MRFWLLLLTIILLLLNRPAHAELVYSEMMQSYEKSPGGTSQLLDNYLTGLYEGINAANIAYFMQSRRQLFCKPGNLNLNPGDLHKIIRESHESFDTNNDIPVSYLLFIGLKETFPCF